MVSDIDVEEKYIRVINPMNNNAIDLYCSIIDYRFYKKKCFDAANDTDLKTTFF